MRKQQWLDSLDALIEAQRHAAAPLTREQLSPEQDQAYRIIGGEILSWRNDRLPDILSHREALPILNFEPDPLLIITTDRAGMVATQYIWPQPPARIRVVEHESYTRWDRQQGIEPTFHVHHWSLFDAGDPQFVARARAAYPSLPADEIRRHRIGEHWGRNCGLFGEHLWRWTGTTMELVEEAFVRGNY